MTFFRRINTITTPFIKNSAFRYSHHRYYPEPYYLSKRERDIESLLDKEHTTQKIIINLLGNQRFVDKASWEIKSFAVEKSLSTANIVYDTGILQNLILKKNYFIVNRCYNISCKELVYLQHYILRSDSAWKIYNLCVFPNSTNRFNTNFYVRNNQQLNIIIYPLAAPVENKRRDIHILIDN